jgi:hypothetical protein
MALLRDIPVRWPMRDARLWEMYAYEIAVYDPCERHAYEMAYERCTPLRWPWEKHVCTHVRCTPVRDTPMRWPMGEAHL